MGSRSFQYFILQVRIVLFMWVLLRKEIYLAGCSSLVLLSLLLSWGGILLQKPVPMKGLAKPSKCPAQSPAYSVCLSIILSCTVLLLQVQHFYYKRSWWLIVGCYLVQCMLFFSPYDTPCGDSCCFSAATAYQQSLALTPFFLLLLFF